MGTKTGTGLTRREFLKGAAALAGAAGFIAKAGFVQAQVQRGHLQDPIETVEDIRYSACLQCHNSCTIQVKVIDGVVEKVDGNPYSPMNKWPPLPYDTPTEEAYKHRGRICPKGQSLLQTTYDPYRVTQPLKRVGPRGSGRWQAISWDQALDEITNGGDLFGEGHVEGLKQIRSFAPIDPARPELGPKANQFVMLIGRAEHGRKDFIKAWMEKVYGSINSKIEHTTICEQSHHIGLKHSLDYKKEHVFADILNAKFLIIWGTNPVEASFGPPHLAAKLSEARVKNGLKIAVIDPRLSRTAAKADLWLPIIPGTDGALAMAMIRWIIENKRYDERYLRNPAKPAAERDGEPTWSDATHLVKIVDGRPERFLRASELGLGKEERVVLKDGKPLRAEDCLTEADLFVDTTLNGIHVKSVFQLLKEEAFSRSLEEYAQICGISKEQIVELAREFTSYGKRAVAMAYRGPAQHTNGFYTIRAIAALNFLIGNLDWKGGWQVGGGHYHELGGKPGNPFSMEEMVPPVKGVKASGVPITREKRHYEDSTEFRERGYPAKRPWFPFTSNVYQEVLPSAVEGYPYPIKALFLVMGTPALSVPAAETQKAALLAKDANGRYKIPLFIASDIVIGETSMFADYILPDLTILERWGLPHPSPDIPITLSKVRQPVIEPVHREAKPVEQVLIEIAERLGLPGYGRGGVVDAPEFFYLRAVANIAFEGTPVPDATPQEMARFEWLRRRSPRALSEAQWRKAAYVLARGCRVEPYTRAYDGAYMGHRYGKQVMFYDEKTATARHSITGEPFSGLPRYEPVKDMKGNIIEDREFPLRLITYKNILGGQSRTISNEWLRQIEPELRIVMQGDVKGKLKSGRLVEPNFGNWIVMNRRDAAARGLKTGDRARIISATNSRGVSGRVLAVEGLRPGVVAVSWHYGHWAYGAASYTVGGQTVKGDPNRGVGLCPNAVMREDTSIGRVCLQDPIGGSASFYDTRVEVVRA